MSSGTVSTPVSTVPLWINGAPADAHSTRRGDICNPSTGEVIRTVPLGDAQDVDRAVAAAAAAFPAWSATPPVRRVRIFARFLELLTAHHKELASIVSEEHGKVFLDAMGSVQRGIEVVEFACGAPHLLKGEYAASVGRDIDTYSRLEPLGVCAGITPFNFPAMVPLWMFPIAIVCGNTFVLKPSEKDPSASVRLAQLLKEAGLPDGVLNVVHGDAEAVNAILTHPGIQAVSFVGSTPIARHVYITAAQHGKRVQALGGAKNHAVVLPDADLEVAADALAGAAYGSAGERCMAISAVVAVGEIADPLVDALAHRARTLKVGPSMTEHMDMGPLVTREHRAKVKGHIDAGVSEGAALVVDGRELKIAGHESGFFLGPDTVRSGDTGDVHLSARDLWSGLDRPARRFARRCDRADQCESLWQWHRRVHELWCGGTQIRGRDSGWHGRHQRAHSCARLDSAVRGLETITFRRPAHVSGPKASSSTRARKS